jgi:hypothetical protein
LQAREELDSLDVGEFCPKHREAGNAVLLRKGEVDRVRSDRRLRLERLGAANGCLEYDGEAE